MVLATVLGLVEPDEPHEVIGLRAREQVADLRRSGCRVGRGRRERCRSLVAGDSLQSRDPGELRFGGRAARNMSGCVSELAVNIPRISGRGDETGFMAG